MAQNIIQKDDFGLGVKYWDPVDLNYQYHRYLHMWMANIGDT